MSNHTPGPWVVADDNRNPGTIAIVHHTVHGYAAIYPPPWHKTSPYPAEQSANARLIAAAPDMCALLGNLAAACDGWDEDWENDEQRADAFWHMARAAKVLLAEIEGGGDIG